MTLLQLGLALAILAGAGLSDLVGQCAVLFFNKVPPRRFVLCLASGALLFVGSALLWVLSLWLLGAIAHLPLPLERCLYLVALAHFPMLLGFLQVLPHFGAYLFHALRAWAFLALVLAIGVATGAPPTVCALVCLPGWALHFSLTHLGLLRLERIQVALWGFLGGL